MIQLGHHRRPVSRLDRAYAQSAPIVEPVPELADDALEHISDADIERRIEVIRAAKQRLGRHLTDAELDRLL
jgi:hypothetical protein